MGMGVDLYVPSLPRITNYFHTQMSLVQVTISIYMFGYSIGQLFLGILSDSYGRRKILLLSGALFTFASFLAIIAGSILMLNICRLIQGVGVAGLAVVARAMLVDIYSGKDLAKSTTYFGLSWSLGPILAPFIGGYLQSYFDWSASFYLFTIYGLIIFVYAYVKLPETNLQLIKCNYCQLYKNIKVITSDYIFLCITVIGGIGYALIVVFNAVGPFLVQNVLKYSVIDYGHIALLLGIAYFLGSLTNRAIVTKIKLMTILFCGLVGALIACTLMIILGCLVAINLYIVIVPVWLIFFLCGFIVPSTLAKTMSIFPKLAGTASSVFGALSGLIVSIITLLASNLKTASQLPMAICYFIILSLAVTLFIISKKVEMNQKLIKR